MSDANHSVEPNPSLAMLDWSDAEVATLLDTGDCERVERFLRRAVTLYFFRQPESAAALIDELHAKVHDPVLWSLATAPEDDEPLGEEELDALNEGFDDLEHGDISAGSELDAWTGE